MSEYKLVYISPAIVIHNPGTQQAFAIPTSDPDYQAWLTEGNTPDPADPPPPPDPQQVADNATLDALKAQYTAIKSDITTISGHCDSILSGTASPNAAQTGSDLKLIAGDMKQVIGGMNKMLDAMAILVRRIRG